MKIRSWTKSTLPFIEGDIQEIVARINTSSSGWCASLVPEKMEIRCSFGTPPDHEVTRVRVILRITSDGQYLKIASQQGDSTSLCALLSEMLTICL